MGSLVLELQQRAMDPNISVADVVRTAMVVATKLGVEEFRAWCELELQGYQGRDVPRYREIEGQLKAWNPVLRGFIPVMLGADATKALATRVLVQSIGELQNLHQVCGPDGTFTMPLLHRVVDEMFAQSPQLRMGMVPTVLIAPTQIFSVLEAVRNTVLTWSLRLENEGIVGEGMTFTVQERERAAIVTYNIQNFRGVLGNVSGGTVQVNDYNALHAALKEAGLAQEERNELERIMDELPTSTGEKRKSLASRGSDWLRKNGKTLGLLSDAVRGWFDMYK